jgi:hypothetical protein
MGMGKSHVNMLVSKQEAKQQALRAMEKNSEVTNAIKDIQEAIGRGEFQCEVRINNDDNIRYFKELGYYVYYNDLTYVLKVEWD